MQKLVLMFYGCLGQQLVVGDEAGCLHLYDVHESLYNVRSSEWDDLTRYINTLPTIHSFNIKHNLS
jgi:hypothetical protein